MSSRCPSSPIRALVVIALAAQLAGCAGSSPVAEVAADEHECLARVMYFESLRNSEDGMLAVGTVVMNRLESHRYPSTVCGVVGQKNQFAPGALTRAMDGRGAALARKVAANVLGGQRHPGLAKKVMFFHTAGYHYPYTNMRYVLAAGGNVFYYKDNRPLSSIASVIPTDPVLMAYAPRVVAPNLPMEEERGLQAAQPVSAPADDAAAMPRPEPPVEPAAEPRPDSPVTATPAAATEGVPADTPRPAAEAQDTNPTQVVAAAADADAPR